MKISPEQEAALVAKGAVVTPKPVRGPAACVDTLETRMSWSEKEFMEAVLKMARERGWKCNHIAYSYHSSEGFVDLVMARDRVIFAELKKQKAKFNDPDQIAWRDALLGAGALWYCWRPSNWEEIAEVLK